MQAAVKSVCLMLLVNLLKLFLLLVFQSNMYFFADMYTFRTNCKSNVETGSVDRKDMKRDCTKALQPNIASVERPELEELVAHNVDRLTVTQGIL